MKSEPKTPGRYDRLLLLFAICFFQVVVSEPLMAQMNIGGEPVRCFIKRTNDIGGTNKLRTENARYELKANQIGNFNCIYNIAPFEKVPIEMIYTKGVIGENVIISVEDGGKLDNNKGVKVVQLDRRKMVAFIFQAAGDPGMYRLLVTKGSDTKVVQLWVGPEPNASK
jgi:hypothetical protein